MPANPDAAARLVQLTKQAHARQATPLREIELTLIADAQRLLAKPSRHRGRLARQIVSGRFGTAVARRVD